MFCFIINLHKFNTLSHDVVPFHFIFFHVVRVFCFTIDAIGFEGPDHFKIVDSNQSSLMRASMPEGYMGLDEYYIDNIDLTLIYGVFLKKVINGSLIFELSNGHKMCENRRVGVLCAHKSESYIESNFGHYSHIFYHVNTDY